MTISFRVASYNIHRCYGRDGRYDPSRIKQVLLQTGADVIGLQEVELLHEVPDLLDYFCDNTQWHMIPGMTLRNLSGHYGNALLTSYPVIEQHNIDLSQRNREPRGAIQAKLDVNGSTIEVVTTHLGLSPVERRAQVVQLLEHIQNKPLAETQILLGDINEWFMWGRPLRWLHRYFGRSSTSASFPAGFPLFALDRIWVSPHQRIKSFGVLKNQLTRVASDHMPVIAEII